MPVGLIVPSRLDLHFSPSSICRPILLLFYTTHASDGNVRTRLGSARLSLPDIIILDLCLDRGTICCLRISAAYCSCYILLTPANMKTYGPSTRDYSRLVHTNHVFLTTFRL